MTNSIKAAATADTSSFEEICGRYGVDPTSANAAVELADAVDQKIFRRMCNDYGVNPAAPDAEAQLDAAHIRFMAGSAATQQAA